MGKDIRVWRRFYEQWLLCNWSVTESTAKFLRMLRLGVCSFHAMIATNEWRVRHCFGVSGVILQRGGQRRTAKTEQLYMHIETTDDAFICSSFGEVFQSTTLKKP